LISINPFTSLHIRGLLHAFSHPWSTSHSFAHVHIHDSDLEDVPSLIAEELPPKYFDMAYIWEIANTTLSDSEKNRFVCCALSMNQATFMNNVDWNKATADYGAASVESMKKGITNAHKKVEKSGGKDGVPAADGATNTPSTSGKGNKRKAGAEKDGGGHSAEDIGTPTPKPKRGRKKQESAASRKGKFRC
jgi:hypothetical protein